MLLCKDDVKRCGIFLFFDKDGKADKYVINMLEDLKKSMILCGHPHYEDEISSIMDKMEKMKGAQHGDENDAAQETEQKRTA